MRSWFGKRQAYEIATPGDLPADSNAAVVAAANLRFLLRRSDMRYPRQLKSRARKSAASVEKSGLSPENAPRSPAFSQALTDARSFAKDPERLRQLFKEAVKKS